MIHNVAWWMFWDAGMGVVGGSQLRLCLLCYSDAIAELREAYATLSAWPENTYPPWAVYQAPMMVHLNMLNKQPGFRPVGIGDIVRRLGVLEVAGEEATHACGKAQVCRGL